MLLIFIVGFSIMAASLISDLMRLQGAACLYFIYWCFRWLNFSTGLNYSFFSRLITSSSSGEWGLSVLLVSRCQRCWRVNSTMFAVTRLPFHSLERPVTKETYAKLEGKIRFLK